MVNIFHDAIARVDEDKRRAIEDRRALLRVLAPVRRLPVEILRHVFLLFVGKNFEAFWVRQGPWLLAKVCRQWRDVALDFPDIWASFRVSSHGPPRFNTPEGLSSLMNVILTLSRNCPLDVYTDAPVETNLNFPQHHATMDLIWEMLCQEKYLKRMRNISLMGSPQFLLASVKPGSLCRLQSLRLRLYHRLDDIPWPGFTELPMLSKLTLIGEGSYLSAMSLPCHQLTHLTLLSRGDVDWALRMLDHCPNLEVLEALDIRRVGPVSDHHIVHNRLRCAVLDMILVRHLTLPALEELELVGVEPNQRCDDSVSDLLKRSQGCRLSKFRLTSDAFVVTGLNRVLRDMPFLEKLEVKAVSLQPIFMDTFLGLLSLKGFLARLRRVSLDIGDYIPTQSLNHQLVYVLRTRYRTGSLKSFRLSSFSSNSCLDVGDYEEMEQIRRDGLDLDLRFGESAVFSIA